MQGQVLNLPLLTIKFAYRHGDVCAAKYITHYLGN